MDGNNIIANVRLCVPSATIVQINKYLLAALDQINSYGVEKLLTVVAVHPEGEYNSDPDARTQKQAFNYYPEARCLILPSTVQLVQRAFYNDVQIFPISFDIYVANTAVRNSYYLTQSGEMYLTFALDNGSSLRLIVRAGGMTIDSLPDHYLPYFTDKILAGLYSREFKDADQYALYSRSAAKHEKAIRVNKVQTTWMPRNGRLY